MVGNQQNPLLGKIAAYTEILAADPQSTIFVSLSESYRKMGMLDEAHTVALEGLTHLPDYAPGHVVMARIKCQQGEMMASEASFKRALELDPDSLAALVGFSRLYLLLDKKAEARNLLLTARELSPADSVINKLLLSLPEPEIEPEVEAETHAPQEDTEPEVVTVAAVEPLETATLADLYLKQGMAEKALNIYRNLLIRNPDNLEFRRRIRDLEMPADVTSETAESSGVVPVPGAERTAIDTDSEEVVWIAPATTVAERPDDLTSSVAEAIVLEQLNGMLTSIQKRRGDV